MNNIMFYIAGILMLSLAFVLIEVLWYMLLRPLLYATGFISRSHPSVTYYKQHKCYNCDCDEGCACGNKQEATEE